MSVNWDALGICHQCMSPQTHHNELCPDHPLGKNSRIRVANIIDYDLEGRLSDPDIKAVATFARLVIDARLYRLTVACPECTYLERRICETCHHPRAAHDDGDPKYACKMFPVCPCDEFVARACGQGCRNQRTIPKPLLNELSRELGSVKYARDVLFLIEDAVQRTIGVEE